MRVVLRAATASVMVVMAAVAAGEPNKQPQAPSWHATRRLSGWYVDIPLGAIDLPPGFQPPPGQFPSEQFPAGQLPAGSEQFPAGGQPTGSLGDGVFMLPGEMPGATDPNDNAPDAVNRLGFGCSVYAAQQELCWATPLDDEDFMAGRCPACRALVTSGEVALEEELRKYPPGTTEIVLPGTPSFFTDRSQVLPGAPAVPLDAGNAAPQRLLTGAFPQDFVARFPNLTRLDLSHQKLTGGIPEGLWALPRLEEVNLAGNALEGQLPESIGRASGLTLLHLASNKLTGALPRSLGQLSRMRSFDLHQNQLAGGIPRELGQWSEVRKVYLSMNKLTGEVPEELAGWRRLEEFDLWVNDLSGRIPKAVGSWPEVRVLRWQMNKFSGSLPEELGQCRKLQTVTLQGNEITGSLPQSLGSWEDVLHVDLSGNQLSGSLPTELGNWRSVTSVDLSSNELSGPIPNSFGNWASVSSAAMSHNKLNGSLPFEIGNWHEVTSVNLEQNELTGQIPETVGGWLKVGNVQLGSNRLTGSIPSTVGEWRLLTRLSLNDNLLTGELPSTVASWVMLDHLDLSRNRLSGHLPAAVRNWIVVGQLVLSSNGFQGALPAAVGFWTSMQTLYLDDNAFSGELPAEVRQWRSLQFANISGNRFAGHLSSGVGGWAAAKQLYLGSNRLSGLPEELGQLQQLDVLDVSDNDLAAVPQNLSALPMLTELRLHSNRLSTVASLPASLRTLDLRRNRLAQVPEALLELRDLEVLLLSENEIAAWPYHGVIFGKLEAGRVKCGLSPHPSRFPWTKLRRLEASSNPMGDVFVFPETGRVIASVYRFLSSVAYLQNLVHVACRNCSLSGSLHAELLPGIADDHKHTGDVLCRGLTVPQPGFTSLETLDLAENGISEVLVTPSVRVASADFSGNALRRLNPAWFNVNGQQNRMTSLKVSGNPLLQMPVAPPAERCRGRAATLVADPDSFAREGEGYECTVLCLATGTQYVADSTLDELALCRCEQGYGGQGKECSPCGADSYSQRGQNDTHGLSRSCVACPARSSTFGSEKAEDISACKCPQGSYLDAQASTCASCSQAPFRSTERAGETQASACGCSSSYKGLREFAGVCGCEDGQHMSHAELQCRSCSYAEDCNWGTGLDRSLQPPKVKAGFWAEPVPNVSGFSKNSIWRCSSKSSCGKGGVCAEGREGRACGLCQPGWHGGADGPCSPCDPHFSPVARRWLLMAAGVLALVPAVMVLHFALTAQVDRLGLILHVRAVRGSLKQMVKHIQTVSVIGGFSVTWPPVARAFFAALESFTINMPTLLAVGCLREQTSVYLEMLFKWTLPTVFAVAALLTVPLSWGASWLLRCLARGLPRVARRLPRADGVILGFPDVARVLLFCVTIFWSTLASNSLEVLTCAPSPNGKFTVLTYPHVECSFSNDDFTVLAVLSFVMALLYMALPLRVLAHGYTQSADYLAATEGVERGWFAFMFDDFRDEHLVWLVVIMAKDALFVLIPAVLPGQGVAQLLVTATLSSVHICLVMYSIPFRDRSNSLLEAWNGATAAALCFYSVGMGYGQTTGVDDVEELFSDGADDPLYLGRAVGLLAVQVVAITVPAAVLIWQLLCALQKTRHRLPRYLRPLSEEEREKWLDDFIKGAGLEDSHLAFILKRFDEVDLFHFRDLFLRTPATMGHSLSKNSWSSIVRRAKKLRSFPSEGPNPGESERTGDVEEGEELDSMEEEPSGAERPGAGEAPAGAEAAAAAEEPAVAEEPAAAEEAAVAREATEPAGGAPEAEPVGQWI